MKKVSIFTLLTFMLVFFGCEKSPTEKGGKKFGSETEINIKLVNKEIPRRGITGKEVGEDYENAVKWLEFYIFDSTGDVLDPAVGKPDEATPGNGYIKIISDKLNHKIKVSAGENKKIIVVANANIGAPIGEYKTYNKILAKLSSGTFLATAGSDDHNCRETPENGFEMSGVSVSNKIIEGESNNIVYIAISRVVSKINAPVLSKDIPVEIATQQEVDEIWGAGSGVITSTKINFEFLGYAVINGVSKSTVGFTGNTSGNYLDPRNIPWDTWSTKTHLNSTYDSSNGSYTNNYSGKSNGSWFLDGTKEKNAHRLYVYENKPESKIFNGVKGYEPLSVYAYIIKGKLKTEGKEDKVRYWRVNFTGGNDIYHIMRNCVYKVTINKIITPGYETPEDAEENPEIIPDPSETVADFVISVNQWDINEYSTPM